LDSSLFACRSDGSRYVSAATPLRFRKRRGEIHYDPVEFHNLQEPQRISEITAETPGEDKRAAEMFYGGMHVKRELILQETPVSHC